MTMRRKRKRKQLIITEGVQRALLRLEAACDADGIDDLRTVMKDGAIHAWANDERGHPHYFSHQHDFWFEEGEIYGSY